MFVFYVNLRLLAGRLLVSGSIFIALPPFCTAKNGGAKKPPGENESLRAKKLCTTCDGDAFSPRTPGDQRSFTMYFIRNQLGSPFLRRRGMPQGRGRSRPKKGAAINSGNSRKNGSHDHRGRFWNYWSLRSVSRDDSHARTLSNTAYIHPSCLPHRRNC